MVKRILWITADLTVAALAVLAVWIVNYKIPQKGIKAVKFSRMEMETGKDFSGETVSEQADLSEEQTQTETQSNSLITTNIVMDMQDWHEKFTDKFTDTVVVFLTWSYIQQFHPRTAVGYYEPGHYCEGAGLI